MSNEEPVKVYGRQHGSPLSSQYKVKDGPARGEAMRPDEDLSEAASKNNTNIVKTKDLMMQHWTSGLELGELEMRLEVEYLTWTKLLKLLNWTKVSILRALEKDGNVQAAELLRGQSTAPAIPRWSILSWMPPSPC